MQVITLYRYTRPDGGVTTSTMMPGGVDYDLRYRLIADEGKALTDGTTVTYCADVATPDGWTEVDDPGEGEEEADTATIEDYQDALAEMGVSLDD